MSEERTVRKRKVKLGFEYKPENDLVDKLNNVPSAQDSVTIQTTDDKSAVKSDQDSEAENDAFYDELFERWEEEEFIPLDFETPIRIGSLESSVGYSSLFRQMHQSFLRTVAFYRSEAGGSLSVEDARKAAFHACNDKEEAKKILNSLMSLPLESLNFVDLMELQSYSPRVAEMFWERAKLEGRAEFESGHLAANITFPIGYMKQLWNIARFLGVRESFVNDWKPKSGIEVALIDMMTQSYFQWQYWLEQTVKRSETPAREEHREYKEWKKWHQETKNAKSWETGYWFPPNLTEQQAIEHAVQMADRFNRIFMRTLRQLRDLRRYSPVTINNPNQVNIAAEGGQQVNVSTSESEGDKSKKLVS